MFGSKVIKKAHNKAAALAAEQPLLQTLCHSRSSSIVNFDARLLASADASKIQLSLYVVGYSSWKEDKSFLEKRNVNFVASFPLMEQLISFCISQASDFLLCFHFKSE